MKKLLILPAIMLAFVSCQQKEILFYPGDDSSFILQTSADFGNRPLEVFYHIPECDIKTLGVMFVMHGASRNGKDYLDWTKEAAEKYGFMLLAPNFPSDVYPTREYQEGGIMDGQKNYNTPEKMTYQLIDDIFEYLLKHSDLKTKRYSIIGHSAGGQFVHRFLQFGQSPYVEKAVAANPGWYTFPDETLDFPYGMTGYTDDPKAYRKKYYSRDLTILLGTADTIRDPSFRTSFEADLQGLTRLERGQTFYRVNKEVAEEEGLSFNWKIGFVEGIGHEGNIMCPEALKFLYGK